MAVVAGNKQRTVVERKEGTFPVCNIFRTTKKLIFNMKRQVNVKDEAFSGFKI